MAPTTSQVNALSSQFVAVTGATSRHAASYLKKYNYDIDRAADAYFAATGLVHNNVKTDQSLSTMFEEYRDKEDDKDTMGTNGMLTYLTDIGVDPNAADLFIALEIVQATTLGELNKQAFVKGWKDASTPSLQLDTIEKQKQFVGKQKQKMATDPATFKKIYRHAFVSAKEKGQRALPLANAIIYWGLLFSKEPPGQPWETSTTNWLELWTEYLEKKWSKSVNKDMWNQTFEFYQKTLEDESMSFWSEDSAWPGVIDEFVVYVKDSRGSDKMETD